jgi:hypothetical protein
MKIIIPMILILFICGCTAAQLNKKQPPSRYLNRERITKEEGIALWYETASPEEIEIVDNLINNIKQRREEKLIIQEGWSEEIKEAIKRKQIFPGMTEEQVIEAWGKPQDIRHKESITGIHKQWVYDLDVYIYFENGILTTVQD